MNERNPTLASIGVIGLGVMGAPIARHLLNSDHIGRVMVGSRRADTARGLVELGAVWCSSPRVVARAAAVILLVVPDLPQIREVCLGLDGIIAGASGRTIVVIHSTCSPHGLRELQDDCDRIAGAGVIRLLDAPISGGEEGAIAGTLAIMVGGAAEDVELVEPALAAFGHMRHFGALGAGQIVKACNQIVVASAVVGLAEAAVIAERAGLDVAAVFATLSQGYAASRVLDSKGDRFASHDHTPSGAARFMIKDLNIALQLLEDGGADASHTTVLLDTFIGVTELGWGDLDTSVAQEYVARSRTYSAPSQ